MTKNNKVNQLVFPDNARVFIQNEDSVIILRANNTHELYLPNATKEEYMPKDHPSVAATLAATMLNNEYLYNYVYDYVFGKEITPKTYN